MLLQCRLEDYSSVSRGVLKRVFNHILRGRGGGEEAGKNKSLHKPSNRFGKPFFYSCTSIIKIKNIKYIVASL